MEHADLGSNTESTRGCEPQETKLAFFKFVEVALSE